MKEVTIYTDGACSGNPGIGGWGAVLLYGEHRKEISGSDGNTTNNRMELYAVIAALSLLKYPCRVSVYSDSAYVVNAVTCGWLKQWERNGWVRQDRKPVLNVDLWEALCVHLRTHTVTFKKVKGHADDPLNNRCDELATSAIKEYRRQCPGEQESGSGPEAICGQPDGGGPQKETSTP